MHNRKETHQDSPIILPIDDPFDTEHIRLGGSSPSLQVEAEIAVRQWIAEHGELAGGGAEECASQEKPGLNLSGT